MPFCSLLLIMFERVHKGKQKYMNKQYIREEYKKMGKNFMTPDIKQFVLTPDNRIVELSTGYDMDGKKIYGVTEFEKVQGERLQTTKRGQMHRSIQSARKHFNVLLGAF